MKIFYYLIISFYVLISGNASSQDFPARGEIYDFNIGDVFHTYLSASIGMADLQNIEIVDKYFSQNSDTVFYTQSVVGLYSSSDTPPWGEYYEELETIFYTNLLDTFTGDSLFQLPELYNNRLIVQTFDSLGGSEETRRYAIGCGEVYMRYFEFDGQGSVSANFDLVYFKKGEEEWGEEHTIVGLDEMIKENKLTIYPNPAKNYITFQLPLNTIESIIYITNIYGISIAEHHIYKGQTQIIWECSNVAKGVYFYHTEIEATNYSGKILIQ
ncbi:T9SS type A sorting domain-containing protein [Lentimicrobium sp. L6]|uniref:T9SS type A sorting domain-containing protein n=1 Tax=Lentimicrobium sp. L6 TaxID=2735916 RepID=UPI00155527B0|nr:T9SS type A sorting domain-containing protein [Lentimicrobium sp. L6]NPD86827.1 T9SS type A sorting domain-containing protein [Lentimicrobium sp. L6]